MSAHPSFRHLGLGPDASAWEIRYAYDMIRRHELKAGDRAAALALDSAYESAMLALRQREIDAARAGYGAPEPVIVPFVDGKPAPLSEHEILAVRQLAAGWRPDSLALLCSAGEDFGWFARPDRLAQLGEPGGRVAQAVCQQATLDEQPAAVRRAVKALLERLAEPAPPTREAIRQFRFHYQRLRKYYPAWRALAVAPDVLARWDRAIDDYPGIQYGDYLAALPLPRAPSSLLEKAVWLAAAVMTVCVLAVRLGRLFG